MVYSCFNVDLPDLGRKDKLLATGVAVHALVEFEGEESMEDQMVDYKSKANGRFQGILRWPQFETLWNALSSGGQDWYVYAPEEGAPPAEPFSADEMETFLNTTETYLRQRCTPDFCGAVYADNVSEPDFVKIYNPRLMGGCGMGKAPLPQWLISRIAPVSLLD